MADVVQVEWDVTHLVRALDFYSKDYEYLQGIFGEDERHEAIRKAVDALNPDKLSIEAANIAVRKAVIDLVKTHGCDSKKTIDSLHLILDMTLEVIDRGFKDSSLALTIIENALDYITVNWIGELMNNFDTRSSLTSLIESNKNKGLMLLRILNETQRRLSKMKYSHLSGWFLTFISNLFPLCERSGVNLRGGFNVKSKYIETDDVANDTCNVSFNDANRKTFYENVLKLQEFYLDPRTILENNNILVFKEYIKKFLDALKHERSRELEIKVELPATIDSSAMETEEPESRQEKTLKILDNHKYITGLHFAEGFNLRTYALPGHIYTQSHYIPFVRIILTSTYFVLQYLLSVLSANSSDTKKDNDTIDLEHSWIEYSISRTLKYLNFKQPYDKSYIKSLELITKHEKALSDWKKNSCQMTGLEIIEVPKDTFNKRVKLSVSETVRYPDHVGVKELTKLWQVSELTDEIISDPERFVQDVDLSDVLLHIIEKPDLEDDATNPAKTPVTTTINSESPNASPVPSSSSIAAPTIYMDPSTTTPNLPTPYLWRCCRVALRKNYEIFCPSKSKSHLLPSNMNSQDLVNVLLGDIESTYKSKVNPYDSATFKK